MSDLEEKIISVAVVDDHQLFRKGLRNLIENVDSRFNVISEACNGKEFLQELSATKHLPDIVILDVNMPVMDGISTTAKIRENGYDMKILALTMKDDESTIIRMLKCGANGYLNKDVEPEELREALISLMETGNYFSNELAERLVEAIKKPQAQRKPHHDLSTQELRFIELACSEDTYQQIADKMFLSIKTIDGYRAKVFEKLGVKSRVGLVMFALNKNIVSDSLKK
jgi:DNA-binding NarL/FixJ family response regulator